MDPVRPATVSSTGLPSRTAALLAYLAWWVTGLIFWVVERRDEYVRFHAAQAVTVFGGASLLIAFFGFCAALALSFLPSVFPAFVILASITWVLGMLLWAVVLFHTARGISWRIPVAAELADRLLIGRWG
jgi:uncharacterized membrane protein